MTSEEKYNALIEKAKSENRVKGKGVYYEGHHIVPKCVGGTGHSNGWKTHPNIILLTAKEHFMAHVYLIDMYPDHEHSLRWALHRMMNSKNSVTPRDLDEEAEIYERMRKEHSEFVSKSQTGRKLSKKTVDKIRKSALERDLTGKNNPFYGKSHTPEMIEFYRTSQLGEKSAMYGKKRDPESVERGAAKQRGVPKSAEHRRKLSEAKKGIPSKNRKYTDEQVRQIRQMTERQAKEKMGVARGTFWGIKSKRSYKDVV